MDRWERRKTERFLKSVQDKAKKDMLNWVVSINREPTSAEAEAWKAGYIAGVNRMTNKDNQ